MSISSIIIGFIVGYLYSKIPNYYTVVHEEINSTSSYVEFYQQGRGFAFFPLMVSKRLVWWTPYKYKMWTNYDAEGSFFSYSVYRYLE